MQVVDTCTKGYALCHSDVVVLVLRRAQKRVYTDKMMKVSVSEQFTKKGRTIKSLSRY